jgi:multidrug efflux pump subunit AcrB
VFENIYIKFDHLFEEFRSGYREILAKVLMNRKAFGTAFLSFCIVSCGLFPFLGRDFFPSVDSGQVRLHFRAPTGTRIEETAKLADAIEAKIKQLIPKEELETILDNLGVPNSGINLSYSNGGTFGSLDGELLIALTEEHRPSSVLTSLLREELPKSFPGVEFFFQPADIVTQILNFGLPAAIDVQLTGNDLLGNAELAAEITKEIAKIPGAVDAHVHQKLNAPGIALEMDRSRLQQLGLNAQNVGQNVLIALSGSSQTSPAFWLNPKNGVVYSIVIQNPQYSFQNLNDLLSIPVSSQVNPVESTQLLGNLVTSRPVKQLPIVSRYNISPAIDIYVNVQGTDLASVANKVTGIVEGMKSKLPKGSQVAIRGQVQTMQSSFIGLGVGLVMAIVLVYLLIVVNFQSWIDSAIIITALPAALAGIAWMLFLTGTTLSVPALTGAIMTMGVATANSILVVSFAKQQREEGLNPYQSALEAGATRIRPVLMTALAMIIGMIPMALGLGEGGEQNAPLGRAVIGGLVFATVSTLFFVPVVFAAVHQSLFDKELKKSK